MIITPTEQPDQHAKTDPGELLIKEAREASRRRRLNWITVFIVVAVLASLIVAATVGNSKPANQIGSGNKNPKGSALTILPCTSTAVSISNGPLVSPAQEEDAHSLKITNASSKSCLMSGFPRLVVYGPTGAVIPFHLVHHPTADFALTSKPPKPFALATHKSAYVLFEQFSCMAGTETTTTKVALLLPKATHPTKVLTLLRPIAHCVGPSASQANPIGISPIEPTMAATEYFQS
jgi:hypothetical protein